jgi:menaquinone-dependent protoporphyrinogen oxidase
VVPRDPPAPQANHSPMGQGMAHLIVYGTVEGHTRKIADAIASQITAAGDTAHLYDASIPIGDLSLDDFRSCIVAAPVHQKRHPDAVVDFVRATVDKLNAMPSAMVSVSLAAAFPDGADDARAFVDHFLQRTGWAPKATHFAAGAVQCSEYDYFTEQILRHVVLKDHSDVEISGEQVFTDWDALNRFVADFIATT